MRKAGVWIAIIVAALIAGGIGKTIGKRASNVLLGDSRPLSKQEASSREVLMKVTGELNKSLPMMVDKDTQLQTVGAADKEIIFNYVLVNYAARDLAWSTNSAQVRSKLINQACSTPEMKKLLENGISLSYHYYGNDRRFLGGRRHA